MALCVGFSEEKIAMHHISWDVLYRPKERGKVGPRKVASMNKSLLAKLAWRLFQEENAIWSKTLRSKYDVSLEEPPLLKHKTRAFVVWCRLEICADLFLQGLR